MHIAWLGKKSPLCGNVTYCRETTRALLNRSHDISFLHFSHNLESASNGTNTLVEKTQKLQEINLPYLYKSTFYTIAPPRTTKILASSLHQLKPDIVHASLVLSPLDFYLSKICRELGLPLCATFHQPFDPKLRSLTSLSQQLTYKFYASALADYDRIIVFSETQKAILSNLGVAEKQIAVIPNGVDSKRYSPGFSTIKQELKAKRLFLYQGRLFPEKNVEALLKAWQRLHLPEGYKLAIMGTGPLASRLKAFYGSDSSIIWLGCIENDQRRIQILRGTDVFILPSYVEGLSLSLLEAMSCGVACLATDVGAHGEVLANGSGIILDINQLIPQLCIFLQRFVDRPELIVELGSKARQRILERYTLSGNIDQIELLYNQMLSERRVVPRGY
jgi:glycosyltransferase involved in cell wall biosynthesis